MGRGFIQSLFLNYVCSLVCRGVSLLLLHFAFPDTLGSTHGQLDLKGQGGEARGEVTQALCFSVKETHGTATAAQ